MGPWAPFSGQPGSRQDTHRSEHGSAVGAVWRDDLPSNPLSMSFLTSLRGIIMPNEKILIVDDDETNLKLLTQ
jgi:hypothetical protein